MSKVNTYDEFKKVVRKYVIKAPKGRVITLDNLSKYLFEKSGVEHDVYRRYIGAALSQLIGNEEVLMRAGEGTYYRV